MSDPIVVCVNCEATLYYCAAIARGEFSGATVKAADFIPVDPEILEPQEGQEMLCPKCGKPFAMEAVIGSSSGLVLMLEGGAWWPHPPVVDI